MASFAPGTSKQYMADYYSRMPKSLGGAIPDSQHQFGLRPGGWPGDDKTNVSGPPGKPQPGGRYSEVAPPVHSPGYAAYLDKWKQQGAGNQGGFSAYSPGSAQPRQNPYAYSNSYGSPSQGTPSPAQGRQRFPNGGPGRRNPATSRDQARGASGPAVDWVKQENERRNSQYRASQEEQKRLGQPLVADGGPQNLYRGDDGQVYETHPMLHGLPGWMDNATVYRGPSQPQATRPTPSQEAGQPPDTPGPQIAPTPPGTEGGVPGQDAGATPPRPPQPTGFQTSWGGSPQPFFGGQFDGFQQPFFGGGQFGGFQQPSFGGGQFLMSLLQGLYPGFM